jgi:hypothetical protein
MLISRSDNYERARRLFAGHSLSNVQMVRLSWFILPLACKSERRRPSPTDDEAADFKISFLIDGNHIDPTFEEFKITRLCLGYLNFRCFQESVPESETKDFVLNGSYSFLDYAAVYWVDHLEEWMLVPSDTESTTSIATLVQQFLQNFWSKREVRTAQRREEKAKFSRFESLEFSDQLVNAMLTWKTLQITYGADSINFESLDLLERISQVRQSLEMIYGSLKGNDVLQRNLTTFYGPDLFKCPRISCKYFVSGFSTEEARDQHVEKHKRSFSCTYPYCPFGTLGFNSVRDLNRHLANSHEARQYEGTQFPITQDPKEIDIKRAIRVGSIGEAERWVEQFSELHMNAPLSKRHKDALLAAVKKGDEAIFRLLLDSLPHITATEISCLCSRAFSMRQDTIGYILLNHPRANPFDYSSGTYESLVATVVRLRRVDILKRIDEARTVNWNGYINTKEPLLGTGIYLVKLLCLAARIGYLELVKILVAKEGIDVDSKERDSRTPLSWAAGSGHSDVVELLLENEDIDIDSKDKDRRTPLW